MITIIISVTFHTVRAGKSDLWVMLWERINWKPLHWPGCLKANELQQDKGKRSRTGYQPRVEINGTATKYWKFVKNVMSICWSPTSIWHGTYIGSDWKHKNNRITVASQTVRGFKLFATTTTTTISTLGVCLNGQIFHIPLQVRSGPHRSSREEPFADCWCQIFTYWMPFLSPNQHCQSTEGIATAMENATAAWTK